ncbi:hypothetical protein AgCh_018263 [Apium graveolens]
MQSEYEMSMMRELSYFLGLQVSQRSDKIFISQTKYLKGTPNLGLWYLKGTGFEAVGYTDVDFAGCRVDRKSTSGSYQFLGQIPVSCNLMDTLSTTEFKRVISLMRDKDTITRAWRVVLCVWVRERDERNARAKVEKEEKDRKFSRFRDGYLNGYSPDEWLKLAESLRGTEIIEELQVLVNLKDLIRKEPGYEDFMPYLPGASTVETVDRSLQQRKHTIQLLKEQLHRAQNQMKQMADKKRSDRQFEVGDWDNLKLQPHRQFSVASRPHQNLASSHNCIKVAHERAHCMIWVNGRRVWLQNFPLSVSKLLDDDLDVE